MHSYKSPGLKARNISRARKPVQRPNSSRGDGRAGACVRVKIPPLPPRKRGGARLGSHCPGDVTGFQPLGRSAPLS